MYYAMGPGGWARGGGFAWPSAPAPTADEELASLKEQAEWMQQSLNRINERIQELSQDAAT